MKTMSRWLAGVGLVWAGAVGAAPLSLQAFWQATRDHDTSLWVARAERDAGTTRLDQAAALWRPAVWLTGTAGLGSADTRMQGAQFSAPGFGESSGVGFGTSVHGGHLTRAAIALQQPLFNRERDAQAQQLRLGAEAAQAGWEATLASTLLQSTERYFKLALTQERQRLLAQQWRAVETAAREAQERFDTGASPITDVHEAQATLAALRAERVALDMEAQVLRQQLSDSTGLAEPDVSLDATRELTPTVASGGATTLDAWMDATRTGNPQLRVLRLALDVAKQDVRKQESATAWTLDLVAQAATERLHGQGDFGAASQRASQQMVGLQLQVPLFTGGLRDAKWQEASHGVVQAQARLQQAEQEVMRQVRSTWWGLAAEGARVDALAQSNKAAAARLESTQIGREVGYRTTLDVLRAENDLATQAQQWAQARVAQALNGWRLQVLSGRLDPAP